MTRNELIDKITTEYIENISLPVSDAASLKAINRKFKMPINYQFKGFMVQCLNELPKVKDKSDSFYRRQLFIPMEKCFTGIERPYIKDDYLHRMDVLEYVLYKALNSNFYELSKPECCKIALETLKEFNDPVRAFWTEFKDEFTWNLLPTNFLYDLFKKWYDKNFPSGTKLGRNTFLNDLEKLVFADEWEYKGNPIPPGDMMSVPEPLIYEYGLTDWMSSTHKGNDVMKISTFDNHKSSYRGYLRIIKTNSKVQEEESNK